MLLGNATFPMRFCILLVICTLLPMQHWTDYLNAKLRSIKPLHFRGEKFPTLNLCNWIVISDISTKWESQKKYPILNLQYTLNVIIAVLVWKYAPSLSFVPITFMAKYGVIWNGNFKSNFKSIQNFKLQGFSLVYCLLLYFGIAYWPK